MVVPGHYSLYVRSMKRLLFITGAVFVSFVVVSAGGLLTPPLSGAGSGLSSNQIYQLIQSTAPTNGGITASEAAIQIAATNNTVLQNLYINQNSGVGTNANLTTPTLTGIVTLTGSGAPTTSQVLVRAPGGIISGISTGTGVLTNDGGGTPHLGYSTTPSISLAGATAGTLTPAALNSQFMPITNSVAVNVGPPVIGQFLVCIGTNSYGASLFAFTNVTSGGGSIPNGLVTNAGPVDIVISNNIFPFTILSGANGTLDTSVAFLRSGLAVTNNAVGIFAIAVKPASDGSAELLVTGTTNGVTANSTLAASNLVALGGSVSVIPTNGAPVYTSNGITAALPFGLTNTLQGRCQYLVGYYVIDAVGGVPVLTVSNELDGYKYPIVSIGSTASITPVTNWFVTPVISTNTVLRIRDESAGVGASVGITSSKMIGL